MKKTIRLTENDLNNIVRSALNEVLDNMDDTEKAYFLMRQRQQRPSKSKNPVNYPQQFATQFNNTMPYSNARDGNGNNIGYSGGYNRGGQTFHHGVDNRGNFSSETYQPDGTFARQTLTSNGDYFHARNAGDNRIVKGDENMARQNSHSSANVQADRYKMIRDRYNKRFQPKQ